MDLRRPFRHADAVASGALARHHLEEGSFRSLFPGVSVDSGVTVTMALRSVGASLAYPDAVVGGLAAAAMWDVDTAAPDRTVDLMVGSDGRRSRPGVRLHRVVLADDEIAVVDGIRVTTPARTAVDVARWLTRVEAVVAADALLRATHTEVGTVTEVSERHRGEHGMASVEPALGWVDPRSPSPRASRLRVALLARGLGVPVVDQRLLDGDGRPVAHLALAWPAVRTGLAHEYGVGPPAARVGWEVLGVREDLAEAWGTRTRAAPVDEVVRWLRRKADRWDPPPRVGGRRSWKLPRPPGPDGECDGGLSRLVPA